MRLELIDLIGQNQTIEGLSIETLYGKMTGIVFKVDERVYAIHATKNGYYLHTLPSDTTFQYAILPNLCNATYSNEIEKGETIRYSDVDTGNLVLSITVVKVDGEYMLEVDNRTVSCTKPETYDAGKEHTEHESSMPELTDKEKYWRKMWVDGMLRDSGKEPGIITKIINNAGEWQNHVSKEDDKVKKIRQQVLETAIHMVCGDRESDYGSPEDSFSVIAGFWEVYINAKCTPKDTKVTILPEDVAAMMALFKLARIASGRFKMDSWVDCAGYCANGAELQERGREKQPDEAK